MSMTNSGNKIFTPSRYSPYNTSGTNFTNEKQKEEVVRLGVELSLLLAEAMFLISDDIHSMLWFCRWLWKEVGNEDYDGPVVGRLFRVFLHVFTTYIKPKVGGVYHPGGSSISTQWELIKTSSKHFAFLVGGLDRIVSILKSRSESFLVQSCVFEFYNQEMKKLEEKFSFAKHVSEANGFSREVIKSNVLHLWTSLFIGINPQISFKELALYTTMTRPQDFHPKTSSVTSSDIWIISKKMESISMTNRVLRHSKRFPVSKYSPYTLWTNEKETQKEEAVRLGVELSLFLAEAMFLLSDDVRSTVCFGILLCKNIGKEDYDGPVVGRLLRVFQYVFATYIKPKNGVNRLCGKSNQCELINMTSQHFAFGVIKLDRIVLILKKTESSSSGLVKSSALEKYIQELKKLEEKLRTAKNVSEANGFAREEIKSNILHLWESLFEVTRK